MSEQLAFGGMPEPLVAVTPTRLATWRDCPRRYRLTYLDRPAPQRGHAWAHTSIGTAVHQALADWFTAAPSGRTVASAVRAVRERWRPEGFRDLAQSARWRERVAVEVAGYVRGQDAAGEPAGVERTVTARTAVLSLSGRVDRLDDRAGELVVVDYKTSRRPLGAGAAAASSALALYAVAVADSLRRPCTAVELHHVPTGEVVRHDHTAASLQHVVDAAEATAVELVHAERVHRAGGADDVVFEPRPGPRCAWCDVREHCPAGRRAAAARRPWAAMERD